MARDAVTTEELAAVPTLAVPPSTVKSFITSD